MRTIEQRRGYFRGTHKGCAIEIERDPQHHATAFYITVTAPDGSHLYDGWAPVDVRTIPDAKREALYGAGWKPRPGAAA